MLARLILVFAFAVLIPVTATSQELASRTFFDGRLTMLVPVGFERMSEEMLVAKYPREQRPTLVFTNPRGSVNVAIRNTEVRVLDEQVPVLLQALEQGFRSQFPSAEWNRSETGQKDDKPYFLLDVVTPAIDTDIRNIIVGFLLEDRMLAISFNCTRELEAQWAPFGQRIIDSISIADR